MTSKLTAGEICLEDVGTSLSIKGLWAGLSNSLARLRCRLVHKSISHPIHGKYRCWTCLQEFDTDW